MAYTFHGTTDGALRLTVDGCAVFERADAGLRRRNLAADPEEDPADRFPD